MSKFTEDFQELYRERIKPLLISKNYAKVNEIIINIKVGKKGLPKYNLIFEEDEKLMHLLSRLGDETEDGEKPNSHTIADIEKFLSKIF